MTKGILLASQAYLVNQYKNIRSKLQALNVYVHFNNKLMC